MECSCQRLIKPIKELQQARNTVLLIRVPHEKTHGPMTIIKKMLEAETYVMQSRALKNIVHLIAHMHGRVLPHFVEEPALYSPNYAVRAARSQSTLRSYTKHIDVYTKLRRHTGRQKNVSVLQIYGQRVVRLFRQGKSIPAHKRHGREPAAVTGQPAQVCLDPTTNLKAS